MTGEARALLYRVAIETGQRRSALERLTVADFDAEAGTLAFKAKAKTKSRRHAVLPVRDVTAEALRQHVADKLPAASLFDMPKADETADLLRADLEAARAGWIAEGADAEERARRADSAFLAETDAEGRRVDFHALRTTCGSWLDHAGVADSVAMKITGHTQVSTLRHHYQRAEMEQVRQALETLPELPVAATGTDSLPTSSGPGRGREDRQHRQQKRQHLPRISVQSGATRHGGHERGEERPVERKPLENQRKNPTGVNQWGSELSEGDGTRTRNLRIDSPML